MTNTDMSRCKDNVRAHFFDKDRIKAMINYLTHNAYTQFGGRYFKQTTGIPIGFNSGKEYSDLYLFYFEYEQLKRWAASGDSDSIERSRFIRRNVDDILEIGTGDLMLGPLVDSHAIYPAAGNIEVNQEQHGRHLHFLDIRLDATPHATRDSRLPTSGYITGVHDKRDEDKYAAVPMTRFPHCSSWLADPVQHRVSERTKSATLGPHYWTHSEGSSTT